MPGPVNANHTQILFDIYLVAKVPGAGVVVGTEGAAVVAAAVVVFTMISRAAPTTLVATLRDSPVCVCVWVACCVVVYVRGS